MSKKKAPAPKQPAPQKKSQPAKSGPSKTVWIVGGIIVALVVAGFAISQSQKSAGPAKPTAEEAKYIGRFLPSGYVEPKVGDGGAVTADTPMTEIQGTSDDSGLSFALNDVTTNRNVKIQYAKADGTPMPLIAYVKPSGKLFVGVSYCVPCKGEGQTLTTDGKLTCDSCGTKRDPESGVGISGACKLYPLDELPVKVSDGKVSIDKAQLDSWTVQPTDRQVGG